MTSLLGLLSATEFLVGLVVGLTGLAVTLLFRRRGPHWAVVWVVCAVAALVSAERLQGLMQPIEIRPWLFVWGMAASSIAATGLNKARRRLTTAVGLAVTMLAIWATIPDTEAISVLVGVTVALAWNWRPFPQIWPAAIAAGALAALTGWVVLVGAGPREGALVGGFGILSTLGLAGLSERWSEGRLGRLDIPMSVIIVSIWFVVARTELSPTLMLLTGLLASGLVLGGFFLASKGSSSNRTDRGSRR